jgi:hypothetical protein
MRLAQVDVQQCTNSRVRLQKRAQEWDVLKERVVISLEEEGPLQDAAAVDGGAVSAAAQLARGNRIQMLCPGANELVSSQSPNADVEVVVNSNGDHNFGGIIDEDDDDGDSYDDAVFEDVL